MTPSGPVGTITRAQVIRQIYRLAGAPSTLGTPAHEFTDVPAWIEDAVRWAAANDVITGYPDQTFRPDLPITRAQVVRILYRLAGSASVSGLPAHPFTDVPPWVEDAVRWAGNPDNPLPLVTGITPSTFVPRASITRGPGRQGVVPAGHHAGRLA